MWKKGERREIALKRIYNERVLQGKRKRKKKKERREERGKLTI